MRLVLEAVTATWVKESMVMEKEGGGWHRMEMRR